MLAQGSDAPADPDEAEPEEDAIVVVATRLRGQVEASQPPIMTLDEADVEAYGASSIGELLDAVSPQVASGRGRGEGRPLILLNGQRISSFRELRSIPPEAIRRMEVLPEEVALRFGSRPDQRVVNFILKDNFSSQVLAGEYNVPTRGGFSNWELEGSVLRINGPRRMNIEAKIVETSMLTEAERDLLQAAANIPTITSDPDPAAFRSLIDESREITLEGSWSTGLGEEGLDGSLSLNAAYVRTDTRGLNALDTVILTDPDGRYEVRSLADPLQGITEDDSFQGGITLNKPLGSWQFTATADGSYSETETRADRERDVSALVEAAALGELDIAGPLPAVPHAGFDRARVKDLALTSLITLNGTPLRLPAGEASVTFNAGFDYARVRSVNTRTAVGPVELDRKDLSAGANIAVPIASRREDVLTDLGDLSLNFSAGVNHLSDFGTLTDWSAGLVWSPFEPLSLSASYFVSEVAPSLRQLGNPVIVTPNVAVYDFLRGEPAIVNVNTGGNPDLLAEKQRDIKLSARWDLPFLQRSNVLVEYFRNRSNDVSQSFPLLTPAIEAAFPERAVRDPSGQLVAIDRRPVTFEEIESSRLRWGINLSGSLTPDDDAEAGERRGRGGPPGFGRGGRSGGRWNISAYHTYRFTDVVTVAEGGPVFDQLGGEALVIGGVPRHSLELEGGAFYQGYGIRLRGRWNAPAYVRATGGPGASDLRFGETFVLNARIFLNLGQKESLVERWPFLEGTRVALTVDNIFESRQRVTNEEGLVPLAYQAGYRDPRGRLVGIDIRKMF